jgi:hypothetical protein
VDEARSKKMWIGLFVFIDYNHKYSRLKKRGIFTFQRRTGWREYDRRPCLKRRGSPHPPLVALPTPKSNHPRTRHTVVG